MTDAGVARCARDGCYVPLWHYIPKPRWPHLNGPSVAGSDLALHCFFLGDDYEDTHEAAWREYERSVFACASEADLARWHFEGARKLAGVVDGEARLRLARSRELEARAGAMSPLPHTKPSDILPDGPPIRVTHLLAIGYIVPVLLWAFA